MEVGVKLALVEDSREGVYRFFAHGRGNTHTYTADKSNLDIRVKEIVILS